MTLAEILQDLHTLIQQRQQPEAAGSFAESVDSSVIDMLGYDPMTQTMTVTFNGGEQYAYHNVNAFTAQAWLNSGSKGRYLNTVIKKIPTISYSRV